MKIEGNDGRHALERPDEDVELTAYALGELEPEAARAVEARLARDPAARAEVEALRALGATLADELGRSAAAPAPLTEAQRAAIVAAAGGPRPVPLGRLLRGPWARLVTGLAAVALLAFLVQHLLPAPEEAAGGAVASRAPESRRSAERQEALQGLRYSGSDAGSTLQRLGYATEGAAPSAAAPTVDSSAAPAESEAKDAVVGAYHGPGDTAPSAASKKTMSVGRDEPIPVQRITVRDKSETVPKAYTNNDTKGFYGVGTVNPEGPGNAPLAGGGGTPTTPGAAGSFHLEARARQGLPELGYGAGPTGPRAPGMPSAAKAPAGQEGFYLALGQRSKERGFDSRYEHRPQAVVSPRAQAGGEAYDTLPENPFVPVFQDPRSTFSIDVDTASYANVRRFLRKGQLPPKDAVRIEELVNAFDYGYAGPVADEEGRVPPFAVHAEVTACPWAADHELVRIALQGRRASTDEPVGRNLVFLVDVSGSMSSADKLPLLQQSLLLLVDALRPADTIGIVTYAGDSRVALQPTPVAEKQVLAAAIQGLHAGGSTNGGAGIRDAYALARSHMVEGGVNRVVLATDGDFNVGVTQRDDLEHLIEGERTSGVFLSVLGFGTGNLKDSQMEALADKGNGNYSYIDSLGEARKVLVRNLDGTLETIAKDVKLQLEFNPLRVQAFRLIGYENRVLAHRDFADDRKDAGDIGAGHSVTALYELVPVGADLAGLPPLKYQRPAVPSEPTDAARSNEVLTVQLRYKLPDEDESTLFAVPVQDADTPFAEASADTRFAAAVASFGMILRDSPNRGATGLEAVRAWAAGALGEDPDGDRHGFLTLVDWAIQASLPASTGDR